VIFLRKGVNGSQLIYIMGVYREMRKLYANFETNYINKEHDEIEIVRRPSADLLLLKSF
jgi:hypothetical protein